MTPETRRRAQLAIATETLRYIAAREGRPAWVEEAGRGAAADGLRVMGDDAELRRYAGMVGVEVE